MIEEIMEADLVIADLTKLNANVFYELAVRHTQGKPYIHIAIAGTKIPFDVSMTNTVFVDLSSVGAVEKSKDELRGHFHSIVSGKASFDNPIKRFQEKLHAIKSGDPSEKRLVALEEKIDILMRRTRETSDERRLIRTGRFQEMNSQITALFEKEIESVLLANNFKFTFNPLTGKSKRMTFLPDGSIGEGRNGNEHSWRITDGRLEIVEESGDVHSRFVYDKNSMTFNHTCEPGLKSVTGQYFTRIT